MEKLNNLDFKQVDFDLLRNEAGYNHFGTFGVRPFFYSNKYQQ